MINDIKRLFIVLWQVAIIFFTIGLLFARNQPTYAVEEIVCHVFDDNKLGTIVSNFIGLSCNYNREWWFFKAYIGALIIGYAFIKATKKIHDVYIDTIIVLIIWIITQKFLPAILALDIFNSVRDDIFCRLLVIFDYTVCSFIFGIVCAKYNVLEKVIQNYNISISNKYKRMVISIFSLIVIFLIAQAVVGGSNLEILYVPLIVIIFRDISNTVTFTRKPLEFIGKHGFNIWLVHTFYCYYFYYTTKIVCFSKNAFIDLAILVSISILTSVIINFLWNNKIIKSLITK